jgi:hypothetical protein
VPSTAVRQKVYLVRIRLLVAETNSKHSGRHYGVLLIDLQQ